MKILKIDDERYFLFDDRKELERVALKVLNEDRVLENFGGKTKDFIEAVTDAQDGDLALELLRRIHDVETIIPEQT